MLLSDVYSDQAKHFHQTRKRPRPEMDYLLPYVIELPEYGNLVDLGCGAGRVYPWLVENNRADLEYIGVDNAKGFTLLAQDLYPQANFVCETMNHYVQHLGQQSTNMIMAIASVQHLETLAERRALFRNSYRALDYGGIFCMTNWAFSDRFLQKYWKSIGFAQFQAVTTLGRKKRNDLSIPRKDPDRKKNGKVYERYYHMFTLHELKNLALDAGFTIEKL